MKDAGRSFHSKHIVSSVVSQTLSNSLPSSLFTFLPSCTWFVQYFISLPIVKQCPQTPSTLRQLRRQWMLSRLWHVAKLPIGKDMGWKANNCCSVRFHRHNKIRMNRLHLLAKVARLLVTISGTARSKHCIGVQTQTHYSGPTWISSSGLHLSSSTSESRYTSSFFGSGREIRTRDVSDSCGLGPSWWSFGYWHGSKFCSG